MSRLWLSLLTLGVVALTAACAHSAAPPHDGFVGTKIGDKAPNFRLAAPDGKLVALSDFRGRPVLLNFWATWCVPCRAEMPMFEEIYRQESTAGFTVLAVNLAEPPAPVVEFSKELRLTFPLLLDQDRSVAAQYKVFGLPASFFIDGQGSIRSVKLGPFENRADIENRIEKARRS